MNTGSSTLTPSELTLINDLFDYWTAFEYDSWQVISFNEKEARYGWNVGGQYTRYVTLTKSMVEFVRISPGTAWDLQFPIKG